VIRFALISTDTNPSRIKWNSRTQDLSNPSLLKIGWAYHNGRPAPSQKDYKPTQSQRRLGDEQKEYKFTTKIGQFFENLKVQSRTKIDNKRSAKIRILLAKNNVLKIILKSIYTQSQKP